MAAAADEDCDKAQAQLTNELRSSFNINADTGDVGLSDSRHRIFTSSL
jgi:hypothetical protein